MASTAFDQMQTINPLLVDDITLLSDQEQREMGKNKKNIHIIAATVANEYMVSNGKKDKKLQIFIELLLSAYPEDDILLQKLVVPFCVKIYGKTTPTNIGKTIDDLQELVDTSKFVEQRLFVSGTGITNISLKILINLKKEDREKLGDREVMLPLINCKGRPRTSLKKGGYLTADVAALTKSKNFHDHYLNLNALNAYQEKMELTIDEDFFSVVPDPSKNDYERAATIKSVNEVLAVKAKEGKAVLRYVPSYDGRGRVYFHAWGLNPNGREWLKALFDLPFEKLNEDGITDLCRYIGTCAGFSKDTWMDREIAAFAIIESVSKFRTDISKLSRKERLKAIYAWMCQPECMEYFHEDKDRLEPYLLLKAIDAYYTGVVLGEPVGLILRQDATTSGLQIMGALDSEVRTLTLTNMLDPKHRHDAYIESFNLVSPHFTDTENEPKMKDVKYAVMTHFYCSKARPKEILGEDNAKVFGRLIGQVLPAGQKVMDHILSCWSDKDEFVWTYQDGHTAVYRPTIRQSGVINWKIQGETVQLTFTWFTVGKNGKHHHLPANIIQGFDGAGVRYVGEAAPFCVVPNHDEFGSHPNNAKKVRKLYHSYLKDISEKNYLNKILKQLNPNYKGFKKTNNAVIGDEPLYGLC